MGFINKHKSGVITTAVIIAIFGLIFAVADRDDNKTETPKIDIPAAEQNTSKDKAAQDPTPGSQKPGAANKDYAYTTVDSDSYTVLARRSVQAYGTANNVPLSPAQIIAAESFLTEQAGQPLLEVGQQISLKNTDVKAAIERARSLSADELAAWETYVPYVVFE
jgi:hypothetical protein